MLPYLVEPESSRTICCKVYKRIVVVLGGFIPEVFEVFPRSVYRELSRESVVFTV